MPTKGILVQKAQEAIDHYTAQAQSLREEKQRIQQLQKQLKQARKPFEQTAIEAIFPTADSPYMEILGTFPVFRSLKTTRLLEESQQTKRLAELEQIQAEADFQARERLQGKNGELTQMRHTLEQELKHLAQKIEGFESKAFLWVYARLNEAESGGFKSFMSAITLQKQRLNKAKAKCCEALGYEDFETLLSDYEGLCTEQTLAYQRRKALEERQEQLKIWTDRYRELAPWAQDFDGALCQALRKELQKQLFHSEPKAPAPPEVLTQLCRQTQGKTAEVLGRCHAMMFQNHYLGRLVKFLDLETQDRERRIKSIARTQRKWKAKPWDTVRDSKDKWLKQVPQMKAESCQKRLRWIRSMGENIGSFRAWGLYLSQLRDSSHFLAYDVFAFASEHPMPYEGFARTVISDLDTARKQRGLEKADYSDLKALKKAYKKRRRRFAIDDEDDDFDEEWESWSDYTWEDEGEDEYEEHQDDGAAEAAVAAVAAMEIMDIS